MTIDDLKPIIESLIFVSEEPMTIKQLVSLLEGESILDIEAAVEQLMEDYNERNGGWSLDNWRAAIA